MELVRPLGRTSFPNIVFDSFIGTTHKTNEDKTFVLSNESYTILAVFDGVGSAKNNSLATRLASEFIAYRHSDYYAESKNEFRLRDMICELNKDIVSHPNAKSSALSTCAVCIYICRTSTLLLVTLGDTRVYAVGKHYVAKLTEDDVIHPGSNVITKCLGIDLDKQDVPEMVINSFKDDILICSDGFYNLLEETRTDFFDALLKKRPSAIKRNIQSLVSNKNTDDASYVLFKNV